MSKTKSKVVPLHPEGTLPVPAKPAKPAPGPLTQKAIQEAREHQQQRQAPFRVKLTEKDGQRVIGAPHDDIDGFTYHYRATFGSGSLHFADRQLSLIATVLGPDADEGDMNAALAFVGGQKPKDEVEAALAVQMVGTHEASMRLLATAMAAKHIDVTERYINMATKLQRTFTAQVEAMKRYRSSGEQTIRVQHQNVTVQDGGQAVVGDVVHGGGRKG